MAMVIITNILHAAPLTHPARFTMEHTTRASWDITTFSVRLFLSNNRRGIVISYLFTTSQWAYITFKKFFRSKSFDAQLLSMTVWKSAVRVYLWHKIRPCIHHCVQLKNFFLKSLESPSKELYYLNIIFYYILYLSVCSQVYLPFGCNKNMQIRICNLYHESLIALLMS